MKVLRPIGPGALPVETASDLHSDRFAAIGAETAVAWWGMLGLVATEATIFLILLSSYLYLGFGQKDTWPPRGIEPPDLLMPVVGSVLLLGSSVPIWWAERRIKKGSVRGLHIGFGLAFVLSAAFLVIQVLEYHKKTFDPTTNAYGSAFFVVTGFHGSHVAVALLMNAVVHLRARLGHFDALRHLAVRNVALYWHFVGAVWVLIFLALYLSPHLVGGAK